MREAGVTNVNIKVNPAKTSVFFQMLMLKLQDADGGSLRLRKAGGGEAVAARLFHAKTTARRVEK